MHRRRPSLSFLMATFAFGPVHGTAQATVECIPTLEGPIAVTGASPAYQARGVAPLPPGYVDREYVVACEALGAPYRTSINVRRPLAPEQPVVVIVESTHPGNTWPVLEFTYAYQVRAGLVSVAINASPRVVEERVKPSNPSRYADLAVPEVEGIEEAILAQVGAALRRDGLSGLEVGPVILGGESATGGVTRRYIAAHHEEARMSGGEPVYNGYFPGQTAVGTLPGPLPDLDVPVIELQGEREIITTFDRNPAGLGYRRPDGELYRLYEVPGMAHIDTHGDEGPNETCGIAKPNQLPLEHVWNMALRNLVEWVRDGVPAPRAERIQLEADDRTIARDAFGNALGGVRTPHVDVPVATYLTVSERQPGATGDVRCDMVGPQFDLEPAELRSLYGSAEAYRDRLNQRLDELVEGRWYLASDADEVRREAEAILPF